MVYENAQFSNLSRDENAISLVRRLIFMSSHFLPWVVPRFLLELNDESLTANEQFLSFK